MSQTRLESLIEAIANIVIGYVVAIASQMLIFPMFGIQVSFAENLAIGGFFTVVSLIRSYALRRWFNGRLRGMARNLAGNAAVPARRVAPVLSAYRNTPLPPGFKRDASGEVVCERCGGNCGQCAITGQLARLNQSSAPSISDAAPAMNQETAAS